RLYVRALWRSGGQALNGLTLWIRVDGQHFVVEHSDASVSMFARQPELRRSSVAGISDYARMLLNVVAAPDGWPTSSSAQNGYESTGVNLYKYSPRGPQWVAGYSEGC